MNIFILDENKSLCAQYHNDKHIVTAPILTAQILSTALYNVDRIPAPWVDLKYAAHGCVLWVGESIQNFLWLCELGLCLCDEYNYRFVPQTPQTSSEWDNTLVHEARRVILRCQGLVFLCRHKFLDQKKLTPFYLEIPDNFICTAHKDFFANTILSYRYYYCRKEHNSTWTKRDIPFWYSETKASSPINQQINSILKVI